ncbi:MAG: trypsin-like peptidase domain-containing protein [Armatimonadetes bacterium]|nr:trypsin-like peptidase domain-containing protein [Armatimonadota bacterium]
MRQMASTYRIVWSGLMGVAVVAFLLGTPLSAQAQEKQKDRSAGKTALLNLQDAFSEVADTLEPAVVTILSHKANKNGDKGENAPVGRGLRRSQGTGSGVIIRADGWILTNEHVTGNAEKVTVRMNDGREYTGRVLGDTRSDLALVKIEDPKPFPFAKLGDSDKVKIGHWAIAVGSPYRYEGSFSVGVISYLYRRQDIADPTVPSGYRLYPQMFQTDATINPGNSGGPLCNIEGEVIAINTAIESDGGGSIGIGFAIPVNTAKYVISQLLETGKVRYGYLGVEMSNPLIHLASTASIERGAYIDTVQDGTPASRAGIKPGDVVLTINERSLKNDFDFRIAIAHTRPGTVIEMTAMRNGQRVQMKATLGDLEEMTKPRRNEDVLARLGLDVQALTPDIAERVKVSPKLKGVYIRSVSAGSPASDNSDLEEGSIIIQVNDVETPSVKSLREALSRFKLGERVTLTVMARHEKKTLTLTIE